MLVPSSDYNRKGTRASALRFDLMARILLHDEHEHESWHLTAVLPTCTVTALHQQDLAPLRLRNEPQ
jgi:hypothetical protein